ncbi:hypothetical protein CMO90_03465 [Candidatus Woesearchaeota archaeon]|nr:hypothetical protein [Candidatus Woesearchaeota archaeon]
MASYTKIILGLLILTLLLASYVLLSENVNIYLLDSRNNEQLIIPTNNLNECCNYFDETGFEKTCSMLEDYSCDNCNSVCLKE